MTNWTEYKLSDVIKVKHGFAFKGEYFSPTPTTDILLSPGNFNIGGGFKADKFKYYKGEYPKSYVLNAGDIIVTMTDLSKEGDTLGFSAKIPKHNGINYLHNQRLGLIELIDDNFNIDFIYWLLRTREYQQFIVSSATGTTVKHTSPSRICEFTFKAPDYGTQTFIAEILSSIDDKIGINNKINQELENIAQILFKRWFIDFEFPNKNSEPYKTSGGEMVESELGEIPKGWVYGNLNQVANLSKLNVKPYENPHDVYYHYSLPEFDSGKIPSIDLGAKILSSKYLVLEHSILVSKLNPRIPRIWTVINPIKNSICSTEFQVMKPFKVEYFPFVNYLCLSDEYLNSIQSKVTGTSSSHQRVNPKDIINFPLALPPDSFVNQFFKTVYEQMVMIDKNRIQNTQLTNLRDTLLPKLISGELEINEINN
jgi:type I restriction enzyme S subunit